MAKSGNFYRDIFIGLFFMAGIFGFLSGDFIVSTLLFGLASLSSNLNMGGRLQA